MLTCSVLIPSRQRPERLERAVRSVLGTAADPRSVEVIVRIDDDDPGSTRAIESLRALGARVLVGPRRQGHASLADFYMEMSDAASAPWIWIMSDDATVVYERPCPEAARDLFWRWDAQLSRSVLEGMFQPEIYQLNAVRHGRIESGPFPIVPNGCWRKFGHERIDRAAGGGVDTWLHRLLVDRTGWPVQFLSGIRVVHERDTDAELAEHRRLA